ncbi:hypothetical protein, partial [Streptomyces clavuligerus]
PHRRRALPRTVRTARPARRAAPALVLVLTTLLTGSACGLLNEESERYTRACGVVVDGSGSGSAGRTGFDARAKLRGSLERFLTDTGCRTLAFAPITRASQSSKCQANTVDLDPELAATEDREHYRGQLRADALKTAGELLTCAQRQRPGSDVVGALSRMAQHRPSGERPAEGSGEGTGTGPDTGPGGRKGSFAVLVVSDFEQNDDDFTMSGQNLATEQGRAEAIGRLLSSNGTPDLSGADLYPVGYGMKHKTRPAAYQRFDAFWTELLEGRLKARVHTTYR